MVGIQSSESCSAFNAERAGLLHAGAVSGDGLTAMATGESLTRGLKAQATARAGETAHPTRDFSVCRRGASWAGAVQRKMPVLPVLPVLPKVPEGQSSQFTSRGGATSSGAEKEEPGSAWSPGRRRYRPVRRTGATPTSVGACFPAPLTAG